MIRGRVREIKGGKVRGEITVPAGEKVCARGKVVAVQVSFITG